MTGRPVRRRPRDLLWLVLGIVVLLAGAVPVHADRVEGLEASAFRLVNDLPSVPFFPLVTALAYVAWPWLPRWGRWAAGAAVAVAGDARKVA